MGHTTSLGHRCRDTTTKSVSPRSPHYGRSRGHVVTSGRVAPRAYQGPWPKPPPSRPCTAAIGRPGGRRDRLLPRGPERPPGINRSRHRQIGASPCRSLVRTIAPRVRRAVRRRSRGVRGERPCELVQLSRLCAISDAWRPDAGAPSRGTAEVFRAEDLCRPCLQALGLGPRK